MCCQKTYFFSRRLLVMVSLALWLFAAAGCQPRIYRFTVAPLTIGPDDSIRTSWDVRGAATLLIHDRKMPGADSTTFLRELTLVVQKKVKRSGVSFRLLCCLITLKNVLFMRPYYKAILWLRPESATRHAGGILLLFIR